MSFDYTGSFSGSFSGDITASNGVISSSAQVNYTQVRNKPTTISAFQKNAIVANNNFRENTYPTDSASFSSRVAALEAFDSDLDNGFATDSELSALSASIASDLGSISTDWVDISNKPELISSSQQIASDISGSSTSLSSSLVSRLDSTNQRIDALSVGSGSADWSTITNIPSGLISSSDQLPSGLLSSSTQVESIIDNTYISASAAASGFGAGGGSTDISALNTFTGSIQTEVDSLTAATSSYLTSLPSGVVSGSTQITDVVTDSYISASAAASGFGAGGDTLPSGTISSSQQITDFGFISSSVDISALNTFTGSIQTEVDSLTTATSSYLTSDDTGSFLTELPSGVVSGSDQITDVVTDSYISSSAAASGFGVGEVYTEGNGIDITSNVISLDTSSAHFTTAVSTSAAAAGFGSSVAPSFGDPPTIDQDGLQVAEFVTSGSTIGTLTVTDVTPGDTATWEVQSSYTDGYFAISEAGVVTANTLLTSSMNTSNASGSNLSHPFLVKVTDGQNNVVTGSVYIYVIPNSAPVFRESSVGGNIITSFTASANENSTNGSTLGTIYFTDANSDTITIETGSVPSELSVTINATNVVITQNTASFDYETTTSYNLAITASDEHYQSGDDGDSISYLPVLINIVDNIAPTIVNNQTLSAINENSSDGTTIGTISATDNESDTITFSNFTLKRAYVNGVGTNVTASMGGTSLYDPHSNPFQMNSSGTVTRKVGVYLNADVADRYEYEVSVNDAFNNTLDTGLITIPIDDDAQSVVSDNWSNVYVIESAVDGDSLYINSNGRSGTIAQWSSAASQRWEVSSDSDLIEVTSLTGSSTQLRVKNDISGSIYSYDGTNTINVALTASEHGFETTKQYIDLAVNVAINNAPSISFSDTSANLNTNGGRSGSLLSTISFSDIEGDALNHNSFTFTDPSNQLNTIKSGDTYLVQPINNLSASSYGFTASIEDVHGFRTNEEFHTLNIQQAPVGGITSNGTLYVIESALSGSNIVISSSGFQGSQADLGVSYSTVYNGAAVASFTSSNTMLDVTNTGLLSLAQDISGSNTGSGDSFTSLITWRDQYDNIGSSTITIQVTENQAPFVSTDTPDSNNLNTNLATSGTRLAKLVWSDYEGDVIDESTFTLSGTAAASLSSSYSGSNTFEIFANSSLSAGTYNYTASLSQSNGFNVGEYNDSITIAQAGGGTLTKNGTFYIIESAVIGNDITTNSSGIAGTVASVGVAYSPNYGSQVAQSFNLGAGHPYIDINSSTGDLVLGGDISGSVYQNGTNITTNVYWLDQYGNEGTGSITVNVTDNQDATATFTDESLTAPVLSGSLLVSATLSDPESGTPFSMSLSGDSATTMSLEPQNSNSSSYELRTLQDITDGVVLSYTASVFDDYNQETQYNRTLTISPPVTPDPLLYVYIADHSSDTGLQANYLGSMGISTVNSDTPPKITAYNANTLSFTYLLKTGDLGTNSITLAASKTATLVASPIATGSVTAIIEDLGQVSTTNTGQVILVIPSGSDNLSGLPTSMAQSFGGSTLDEYVMQIQADGGGWSNTTEGTTVHEIVLDSAVDGFTDWFIVGRTGFNAFGSSMELRVIPSSGSAQT